MSSQPTIGRFLHYTLTAEDAQKINRRRTTSEEIIRRINNNDAEIGLSTNFPDQWPLGAQAHIGNTAYEGQVLPMIVTATWPYEWGDTIGVNGQVFLDGNDTYWVTSAKVADQPAPGVCHWPLRAA
jgi:hypothetical protein